MYFRGIKVDADQKVEDNLHKGEVEKLQTTEECWNLI